MVRVKKASQKQSSREPQSAASAFSVGFFSKISSSMASKALPAVYFGFIVLAFLVGVLWQKVDALGKGSIGTTTQPDTQTTAQATPTPVTLDQIKGLFSKDLIKFGDTGRKVLFVAVEDPSCPYCHAAAGLNPSLNNQFGPQFKLITDGGTYVAPVIEMRKLVDSGKASLVYIYTPGHGNGEMGQKALYCAYEKGAQAFWKAHDLLYSAEGYTLQNTTVLNDKSKSQVVADFLRTAVDPAFLKSCLDSGKYDSRLANDSQIAASLEVNGTPGFFINTTRYAGAYSYKDMENTVSVALGK